VRERKPVPMRAMSMGCCSFMLLQFQVTGKAWRKTGNVSSL